MRKRNLFMGGGVEVLGLAQIEQKIEGLQARLAARLEGAQERIAERVQTRALQASVRAAVQEAQEQQRRMEIAPEADDPDTMVFLGDEGTSWLGVESQEVTSGKAKELKLPAERGVLLGRIVPDSPAAKAGLKDNDVITEI